MRVTGYIHRYISIILGYKSNIFGQAEKAHFISEVKKYLSEENLALNALALLDNVVSHSLEDLQSIDKKFTIIHAAYIQALIQQVQP